MRAPNEENPKHCVISWSGGMDSTSLIVQKLREGYTIHSLSFNYGQKHEVELDRVRANLTYFAEHGYHIKATFIDLRSAFEGLASALIDSTETVPEGYYEESNMKQTVVPNRNAIFTSIIYAHALSLVSKLDQEVEISLGVHSGDHAIYPDCRPDFYTKLIAAFESGNWDAERVTLSLPYINDNKTIILQDGQSSCEKLGLDFDTVYRNTITSYAPDAQGRSSGKTGSDTERILAFAELGLIDPIEYAEPWDKVLQYALSKQSEFKNQQSTILN